MIHKEYTKGYMYRVVEFCLGCGTCQNNLNSLEYYSQNDFLRYARSLGWSIGNEIKCPNCKGVIKNE